MSTVTTWMGTGYGVRTNSRGESHCFHCGETSHWAFECPQLSKEQQAQLHMKVKSQERAEQQQPKKRHQLLNITFTQGTALSDNRAYLDGCSMVTAFKTNKDIKEIRTVPEEIKINSNAGAEMTSKMGKYGGLKVWYISNFITNIFSMHELEKMYCITYNSWDGFYMVHTPKGQVQFNKDEEGLPYFNLEQSSKAAIMLLHHRQEATE